MKLSQHAMCQPITGLGSDAVQACNAVKILPIKESAEAQNDRKGRVDRDFSGSHSLQLLVNHITSQPGATRDFCGPLA